LNEDWIKNRMVRSHRLLSLVLVAIGWTVEGSAQRTPTAHDLPSRFQFSPAFSDFSQISI
jgi:hypothetical protein